MNNTKYNSTKKKCNAHHQFRLTTLLNAIELLGSLSSTCCAWKKHLFALLSRPSCSSDKSCQVASFGYAHFRCCWRMLSIVGHSSSNVSSKCRPFRNVLDLSNLCRFDEIIRFQSLDCKRRNWRLVDSLAYSSIVSNWIRFFSLWKWTEIDLFYLFFFSFCFLFVFFRWKIRAFFHVPDLLLFLFHRMAKCLPLLLQTIMSNCTMFVHSMPVLSQRFLCR